MTPELAAHKRSVDEMNKSMRAWNSTDRMEEIMRLCGIIQSHAVSATEAAWRGDEDLTRNHLGRLREALILALKLSKESAA